MSATDSQHTLHGVQIQVESTPGLGSTFALLLSQPDNGLNLAPEKPPGTIPQVRLPPTFPSLISFSTLSPSRKYEYVIEYAINEASGFTGMG